MDGDTQAMWKGAAPGNVTEKCMTDNETKALLGYTALLGRIDHHFKPSMMSDFSISDQIWDPLGCDLWSHQVSDLLRSDLWLYKWSVVWWAVRTHALPNRGSRKQTAPPMSHWAGHKKQQKLCTGILEKPSNHVDSVLTLPRFYNTNPAKSCPATFSSHLLQGSHDLDYYTIIQIFKCPALATARSKSPHQTYLFISFHNPPVHLLGMIPYIE